MRIHNLQHALATTTCESQRFLVANRVSEEMAVDPERVDFLAKDLDFMCRSIVTASQFDC